MTKPRTRDCPQCGATTSATSKACAECGHEFVTAMVPRGATHSARANPDLDVRCEWIGEANHRCRYPGAWSYGTTGVGPWYCSAHSRCNDPVLGAAIVEESIRAGGDLGINDPERARLRRYNPAPRPKAINRDTFVAELRKVAGEELRVGDHRAWALAVVLRHLAGDPVPSYTLDCACAAMGATRGQIATAAAAASRAQRPEPVNA